MFQQSDILINANGHVNTLSLLDLVVTIEGLKKGLSCVLLHVAGDVPAAEKSNITGPAATQEHLEKIHGKHGEPPGMEPKDPLSKFNKVKAVQGMMQKEAQRVQPPNYWAPNAGKVCQPHNPPASMECTIDRKHAATHVSWFPCV